MISQQLIEKYSIYDHKKMMKIVVRSKE